MLRRIIYSDSESDGDDLYTGHSVRKRVKSKAKQASSKAAMKNKRQDFAVSDESENGGTASDADDDASSGALKSKTEVSFEIPFVHYEDRICTSGSLV